MSRRLTASDRSALIRLASTMPVGSDERRAILAGLSRRYLPSSEAWDRCNADSWLEDWIKKSEVYVLKTKEALEELGCTRIDIGDAETSEIAEGLLYYMVDFVLPEGKRVEFFLEFYGELEETEVEHWEQLDVDRFKEWYTTEMCIPEMFDTVRISKEGGPVGAMEIFGMIDVIDIEKVLEKQVYRAY